MNAWRRFWIRSQLTNREKSVLAQALGGFKAALANPQVRAMNSAIATKVGVRLATDAEIDAVAELLGDFESE